MNFIFQLLLVGRGELFFFYFLLNKIKLKTDKYANLEEGGKKTKKARGESIPVHTVLQLGRVL